MAIKKKTEKQKKLLINNTKMSATKKLVNTSVSCRKVVAKVDRFQQSTKSVKVSDETALFCFISI